MRRVLERLRGEVRYWRAVAAEKSYLLRPYDPVADRRRWVWQCPAPCGRQQAEQLPAWVRRDLTAALQRLDPPRGPATLRDGSRLRDRTAGSLGLTDPDDTASDR